MAVKTSSLQNFLGKNKVIIAIMTTLIVILVVGLHLATAPFSHALPSQPRQQVTIVSQDLQKSWTLNPEVVKGSKVDHGLMNRTSVSKDGMLFDFDKPGIQSFTMYNTKIPLKITWLSEDFKIAHSTIAQPCPRWKFVFCPTFDYDQPVRYVIETPVNGLTD